MLSNNFEQPLKNKTIVLTRSPEQASQSSLIFEKLGAKVILFPTIKIVPPKSWDDFDKFVKRLGEFDYIIFASPNAVKYFHRRCKELGVEAEFNSIKVVAVGKITASMCVANNIPVHITPYKSTSKGIMKKLNETDLKGKQFFIPKSAIARDELKLGIEEAGGVVHAADVYDVVISDKEEIKENIEDLLRYKPDVYVFTSPSTFENFLKIMNLTKPVEYFHGSHVATIGPTTKSVIEKSGVRVDIMPLEHSMDAVAKTLVDFYKSKH